MRAALYFVLYFLSPIALVFNSSIALACSCGSTFRGCTKSDCPSAVSDQINNHLDMDNNTMVEWEEDLTAFDNWMIDVMHNEEFSVAMQMMTNQMNAIAMQQLQIIGSFLDAENQLDTQLLFQRLKIEAHRDYHPSEEMCAFGTVTKSLAATESLANHNRLALSEISLSRQLGNENNGGATSDKADRQGRWRQFVRTYCDVKDNNWLRAGTGLELACDHDGLPGGAKGGVDLDRRNKDIDYARLVQTRKTIDVDFTNGTKTDDEEDVIALAHNLYGNKVLLRNLSNARLTREKAQSLYILLRSVAAKRNVAQDSYNAIIGLKSNGSPDSDPTSDTSAKYMASIVKELLPAGTSDEDIYAEITNKPSYYAQLEILSKRIYQNPDFYAQLYDKPANVERKEVAMKAIELMLDRAIYESQLRKEMSVSVLLSSKLRSAYRDANTEIITATGHSK